MVSKRKILIDALEENLLPFLIQKGFKRIPAQKNEKWYFPLGKLKRKRGVTLEWIDFQFDKNGQAKFIPNLRVSRSGKFESSFCRLQASTLKSFEKWFSMPWFAWPFNDEVKALKAAKRVEEFYPEVEEWFSTRKAGPHIRYFQMGDGSWV